MSGTESGLSDVGGYVEWLGLNEEPTILREVLILILSPAGYVGVATGIVIIAFLKWRSLRRIEAARNDLVSRVAAGRGT